MSVHLHAIAGPDCIRDVCVVDFAGAKHFAALLGTHLRLYTSCGTEVASLALPVVGWAILSDGHICYVICEDRTLVVREGVLGGESRHCTPFGPVLFVKRVGACVFAFHGSGYSIGKLSSGGALVFDCPILHSSFNQAIHAVQVADAEGNEALYILTETIASTKILKYTVNEGGSGTGLSFERIESPRRYTHLFAVMDTVYGISDEGIWETIEHPRLVRRLGNSWVYATHVCLARRLIYFFCRNGQVLEMAMDFGEYKAVAHLDYPVTRVCGIGDFLFIAGAHAHAVVSLAHDAQLGETSFNASSIYSVRRALSPRVGPRGVEFASGNTIKSITSAIRTSPVKRSLLSSAGLDMGCKQAEITVTRLPGCVAQHPSVFNLRRAFKAHGYSIVSYDSVAYVNGAISDAIEACYESKEAVAFTTKKGVYVLRGDQGGQFFGMPVSLSCCAGNTVFLYGQGMLHSVGLSSGAISSALATRTAYCIIPVEDGICLGLLDGSHCCIPFTAFSTHANNTAPTEFGSCLAPDGDMPEQAIGHLEFIYQTAHSICSEPTSYFSIGATIYRMDKDGPIPLFTFPSHVHGLLLCSKGLLVACSGETYLLLPQALDESWGLHKTYAKMAVKIKDVDAAICIKLDLPVFPVYAGEDGPAIFIYAGAFRTCSVLSPSFSISQRQLSIPARSEIVYWDAHNTVTANPSECFSTTALALNGVEQIHRDGYAKEGRAIADGLFALLFMQNDVGTRLEIYAISDGRIKLRKALLASKFILAMAVYREQLIAVLPDRIQFYQFHAGRTRLAMETAFRGEYAIRAEILAGKFIAVVQQDCSYALINLDDATQQQVCVHDRLCLPFSISNKVGWVEGARCIMDDTEFHLGEEVVDAFQCGPSTAFITYSGAAVIAKSADAD